MKRNSLVKITDINTAIAVIAHEAVPCFCGKEQACSATPEHMTSCAGGVFWGRPGEQWPTSTDGQPLIPWLQIVCSEMDGLYGAFYNRQAVCFYIRQDFSGYEATSSIDGSDFVVREYGPDDKLAPIARPAALAAHQYHQVVWEKVSDYPSISKYHELFDEVVYDSLCKIKDFQYGNRSGIKIGGWPTPIQQEQEYPGSHELQIDMTENFMYGDSGIGYLLRMAGKWYVIFECC